MLSDEAKELIAERLANRIEKLNTFILKEIAEDIAKLGKLTPSKAFKLANIMKYGGSYNKIVKEIQKVTNMNVKEIEEILDAIAEQQYLDAKQYYELKHKGYIPYNKNEELRQQVNALKEITKQSYTNFSDTSVLGYSIRDEEGNLTFQKISDAYKNAIDDAVVSIYQGKEDFDRAFKRTILDFGNSGLKSVDYESGRTRRLDSAVRMNIQGAIRDLQNTVELEIGKQTDCDGIEISVHLNPAPDHEPIQGHQFRLAEFNKMQNSEPFKDIDNIHFDAIKRHIGEYNCQHNIFSITVGIDSPTYSKKELRDIIKNNQKKTEIDGKEYTKYECTQLQRRLETEIRKQKDIQIMAKAGGRDDIVLEAQKNITDLTRKYKEISEKAGIPTQMQRMTVSGYKRIDVRKKDKKGMYLMGIEIPEPVNTNKYSSSSKIFDYSKKYLDLTDEDNLKIFNATNKLDTKIIENGRIKHAYYSRKERAIHTTGVKEGDISPVTTLWHEFGHALDNYKGGNEYLSNYEDMRMKMYDFYDKHREAPDEIIDYFKDFRARSDKEFEAANDYNYYYDNFIEIKRKQGASEYNLNIYKDNKQNNLERYKEQVDFSYNQEKREFYWQKNRTDIEYNQKSNLSDMFSAISKGNYNKDLCGTYGYHTTGYFLERAENPTTELFANFVSLKMTGSKQNLEFFKKVAPEIYDELDKLYKKIGDDLIGK